MRLAIFARINDLPDLIPLDISIPDKDLSKFSVRDIAKHICAFAKISIPGSINPELSYVITKGGVPLNTGLSLTGNGINNGDIVDLVIEHRENYQEGHGEASREYVDELSRENQTPYIDATKKETGNTTEIFDRDETQYQPIPGRKIDFD